MPNLYIVALYDMSRAGIPQELSTVARSSSYPKYYQNQVNYIAVNQVALGEEPPLHSTFATDFLKSLDNLQRAQLQFPNDIASQFH